MTFSESDLQVVKDYVRHVPVEGSHKAHANYVRLVALLQRLDPSYNVNNPTQLARLQKRTNNGSPDQTN